MLASEQVVWFCAVAHLVVEDGSETKEILESFEVKNCAGSCVVGDFEVLK